MSRKREFDVERLTRDYRSREHTLDELCTIHRCGKRSLVRALRELGLSGSGGRGRGPAPVPIPEGVLSDYAAGELHMTAIARRWSVSLRDVYRAVREGGIVRRRELRVRSVCRVCGESYCHTDAGTPGSLHGLCSSECLTMARLHPELGIDLTVKEGSRNDPKYAKAWRERKRKIQRYAVERTPVDMKAWNEAFQTFGDVEVSWVPKWRPAEYKRGMARRAGSYFGAYADASVMLRLSVSDTDEVYFSVTRRPDETTAEAIARQYLGGMPEFAEVFDVALAWRCGCPTMTEVVVERLEDFPDEPGDYGLCPQCGVVAVEVRCAE